MVHGCFFFLSKFYARNTANEFVLLSSYRTQRPEKRVILRFRGLERSGLVRQGQIGAESHVDLQVHATRARDQIADVAHRAGTCGIAKTDCH